MRFVKTFLALTLGFVALALSACDTVEDTQVYFWTVGSADYSNDSVTSWATINMASKVSDDGNDFDLATSTFTVPVSGLYHFDASTNFGFVTYPAALAYRYAILGIFVNDMTSPVQDVKVYVGESVTTAMNLNVTLKLTAGDKVALRVMAYSPIHTGGIGARGEFFGGYLVD